VIKGDKAPVLRNSVKISIELNRWAVLYETGHLGETVGDPAGYILQGDPQTSTPGCRALSNESPPVLAPAGKS